jgi:Family of unknown function (DUF5519)
VTLELTRRRRGRPATHYAMPHQQLDQTPSPEIYAKLLERLVAVPETTNGPSLVSVPGAHALFLASSGPCNEQAFLRGREFAHLHPSHDGSLHVVLSPDDCSAVVAAEWGELHPLAASGQAPPGLTMVYAPGDEAEIEIVLAIVSASLRFARTATLLSRR